MSDDLLSFNGINARTGEPLLRLTQAELTQLASGFPCEVWLERNGRRVNAKSIMGVMMLAAGKGTTIQIETEGDDESAAMDGLVALINDKFGEGE